MNAYEALITRRSPAEFKEPGPDKSQEAKILSAATRAPDHGRMKPWRFIVLRGEDRARFGGVLADALAKRVPGVSAELLDKERGKPMRAPLVIVVIARIAENPKVPAVEQLLAAGAAAQNIMLASHALGFGCAWKTGDPAYDPNVKQSLGLAPTDEIVGFMYIGTAKSYPPEPAPVSADEFVLSWNEV